MAIVHITKENFPELSAGDKPLLIDFWATWCGPCRMIAPIVEQIATERSDIIVGKIDVDQELELAQQFGIVSIPTLVLMKNGTVAATLVGYRPKADIEKMLNA